MAGTATNLMKHELEYVSKRLLRLGKNIDAHNMTREYKISSRLQTQFDLFIFVFVIFFYVCSLVLDHDTFHPTCATAKIGLCFSRESIYVCGIIYTLEASQRLDG